MHRAVQKLLLLLLLRIPADVGRPYRGHVVNRDVFSVSTDSAGLVAAAKT